MRSRTRRLLLPILAVLAAGLAVPGPPARAQQAEAKDAARLANCTPGKVETMKRLNGRTPEIIYKIACTGQKDTFVLIQCRDRICTVLR